MKVTITVTIPEGKKCEGCRFLEFEESGYLYRCALFNKWELGEHGGEVHDDALAFKCKDCLELKEEPTT